MQFITIGYRRRWKKSRVLAQAPKLGRLIIATVRKPVVGWRTARRLFFVGAPQGRLNAVHSPLRGSKRKNDACGHRFPRARAAWLLSIVPAALWQTFRRLRAKAAARQAREAQATTHERRATSHERRATSDEVRIPVPGRWPPSAILAVPSPLESKKPRATSRERRATSHEPARLWRVFCSPLPVPGPWPMTNDKGPMTVVPTLPFRNKLSTAAYAQECMSKTIKFESKSIKKATFSVKKRSKTRAFRHAHLNIWGGSPPLALAPGPFCPSPRVFSGWFRGQKGRVQKLSTKWGKPGIGI